MLFRTHIALGVFAALLFLPHVEHKLIFASVVLVCSLLPDIDCMHSYFGRRIVFRPLQWIVRHRSVIHSITFCAAVSILFAFYVPVLALPFFVGFCTHLIGDALTPEGIRPFWPHRGMINGRIRTGGKRERVFLVIIISLNIFLLIRLFS